MNIPLKYLVCGNLQATTTGKLLYLILNDMAGKRGEVIIPQRKIGGVLGVSKGTVSRNLRTLAKSGYIAIQSQYHSDGGRAANKYILK